MRDFLAPLLLAIVSHVLLTEVDSLSSRWTKRLVAKAAAGVEERRRADRLADWEAELEELGTYLRLLNALSLWWAYWLIPSLPRYRDSLTYATGLPVKRTLDVAGAAGTLVLTAPILLGVAIALKLERRGPVFASRQRWGRGGQRFSALRFRGDSSVGRWLQRLGLSHMPMLLNILRGDMSFVGPAFLTEEAATQAPGNRFRPGLTGEWLFLMIQDLPPAVDMDDAYVGRWSLRRDAVVLWRLMVSPAFRRR